MDMNIILLYVQLLLHRAISAKICANDQKLVDAGDLDLTQRHIREYFRHISCSQASPTFYRCKVECLRQESCLGFRYVSFCELCIYSSTRSSGELILDFLNVKPNIDVITQNLGK